ncbi:hypothetical protein Bb109J_c2594 [Bdellovibrio bacteriovorus]|nr:hypothetical protein Bb109J_c2594 [Bdellovibrio bacteriovorus]
MHLFLLLTQLVWAAPQTALYERPCYIDEGDALTTHLQVADSQWIMTHVAYEEDACKQPYLTFEIQYNTVTVGTAVDMTVTESSYTPLT